MALANELVSALKLADEPIDLANALARDSSKFSRLADQALTGRPRSAQLLLFVDQLEQLFTRAAERYRKGFCDLLSAATRYQRVRVLATLREDFRREAEQFESLANFHSLNPPGAAELVDMIRCPAERVGVKVENELVNKILRDAGSNPGAALPQIAFCLKQLYEMCAPAGIMTVRAYQGMGGLHDAIGERADKLLDKIQPQLETNVTSALHGIFSKLVTIENGKVIRKPASLDMLGTGPVQNLVEKLIDGKILICSRNGTEAKVCDHRAGARCVAREMAQTEGVGRAEQIAYSESGGAEACCS